VSAKLGAIQLPFLWLGRAFLSAGGAGVWDVLALEFAAFETKAQYSVDLGFSVPIMAQLFRRKRLLKLLIKQEVRFKKGVAKQRKLRRMRHLFRW